MGSIMVRSRILHFHLRAKNGQGWQWVGDHIRPRVRVPESCIGLSISNELGYQRRNIPCGEPADWEIVRLWIRK